MPDSMHSSMTLVVEQHAAEATQFQRRQGLAEKRKYRSTVHHGRFVKEAQTAGLRQFGQMLVRVDDWAFVRANGVRPD